MNTKFEFKKPDFENFKNRNFGGKGKKALKVSLIAFLIMLVISVGISAIRTFSLGGMVRVNVFSVLLALHLVDMKIRGMMLFSATTVNIGVVIVLLLPIIAISISNFIVYRRKFENMGDCIYESIKIAFIYGMILAIVSLFSKIRINMGMDSMFGFGMNNSTIIGYKMISSFANGFIISFLISIVLNWKKEFRGESYLTDVISDGFKVFLKVVAIVLVITSVVTFTKNYSLSDFGLSDYSKGMSVIAYIVQITSYLLAIASGGAVNIGNNSDSLSVFSIFNSSVFTDTRLLIAILFSSFALIMIFEGANIYKNYRFENKKTVIHFSVVYAFLVGLVAKFSSIALSTSSSQIMPSLEIIIRVNPLSLFVIVFALSVLFLEVGYIITPNVDNLFSKYDNN